MADAKISALTSATTPLGGTEVLPIVQGGQTLKVSVANLTAGRSISAAGMNSSGTIALTSNATYINGVTTGATSTRMLGINAGNTVYIGSIDTQTSGGVIFINGTQFMGVDTSNNVTVNTGNLKMGTAGKGIDFSANTNAAGMTSELLSWYEEGTWSGVLTDGTNNATMTATTCKYTRIGRSVFVCGNVSTSSLGSVSGNISISGLPFTIASFAGGSVTYAINLNIAAGNNVQLLANNSGTSLLLFNWDATTGTTWMQASEWTNSGNISFSAMYFV